MASFKTDLRFKAFDGVSKTVKKFQRNIRGLQGRIRKANNQFRTFQKRTEALRRGLGRAGAKMKSVGSSMTTSISAPIALMGAGITRAAFKFQKGMNRIEAKTGESGKALEGLRKQAKELGATTQFSASQAADGMAFLAQAGFNTKQIMSAIPQVLNLAAASEMDLARSADIASNIMGAFNIKAEKMGRVSDVLATVTASSNVNMEQLAESMKNVAPQARAAGASLEETSAVMGLLGNIGIQGSKAGVAFRRALVNLTSPTKQIKDTLSALNIEVADSDGNIRNMTTIMGELGTRMGDLTQKQRAQAVSTIFGARAVSAMTSITEQAAKGELQKFGKSLLDVQGNAKKMANTMMKGAVGAFKRFQSALEAAAIAIAESGFLDMLTSMANSFASFFRGLSKSNPLLLKMGTFAAILAAALGPLVFIAGSFVAMIPAMITGLSAVAAFLGISVGAALGLAGAVGALVAALVFVVAKFDAIRTFLNENPFLKLMVQIGMVITPVGQLFLAIKALVNLFGDWEIQSGIVGKAIDFIAEKAKKLLGFLNKIAGPVSDALSSVGINLGIGGEGGGGGRAERAGEQVQEGAGVLRQTNDARVKLDITGVPQGSSVLREGDESPLDLSLGFAGT